ncbi:MAG: DUF3102 domain-containing protein [Candidatus Limiplasma sp.]|nr:DUF3102 domain-containing protein [Candidatus Limiplasma sp.]
MGDELQAMDVNWKEAARGAIEYRIRQRKENITREFYGIGDDLNEARERGIVARGEWEGWVTEITGLNIRTAQRMMQAAREVPPEQRLNSAMGQLEFRQLSAVLALPEGEREAMADRAVDEGLSTREVEEAVRQARADGQKAAEQQAAQRVQNAEQEAELYRAAAEKVAKNYQKADAEYAQRLAQADARVRALEAQMATAAAAPPAADGNGGEEARRLRAELASAQAYAREQARLRKEAQEEMLRAQSQTARDDRADAQPVGLTLAQFAEAARAFVGRCGALPHMRAQLLHTTRREREEWESAIAMVQTLLDGGREALNLIDGGVIHG